MDFRATLPNAWAFSGASMPWSRTFSDCGSSVRTVAEDRENLQQSVSEALVRKGGALLISPACSSASGCSPAISSASAARSFATLCGFRRLAVVESVLPLGCIDLHTDWIRISKAGQLHPVRHMIRGPRPRMHDVASVGLESTLSRSRGCSTPSRGRCRPSRSWRGA